MNNMRQEDIAKIAPYTEELLAKMLDGQPYLYSLFGKEWMVLPGVFSPRYYTDPEVFTPVIAEIVGNTSMIEVGCGVGITACCCAFNGAHVLASDINPIAVKNTDLNRKLHGCQGLVVYEAGSLFEPFDWMRETGSKIKFTYWNHPWNGWASPSGRGEDIFLAGFDPGYEAVKTYIRQGKDFVLSTGGILLATSTIADWEMLLEYGRSLGYKAKVAWRQEVVMEPGGGTPELDWPLEFMILQFTPWV